MAKFDFIKRLKKKEVDENQNESTALEKKAEKKTYKDKKANKIFGFIWEHSGDLIEVLDEILEEVTEIAEDGFCAIMSLGASLIDFYDKSAAVVEWFILKSSVLVGRKQHDLRIKTIENKGEIIKNAIILMAGVICIALAIALTTGYQYSYNGRPLGIVKEHKDVLEILELASEELSQEYGSNIEIDPAKDITFKRVVSYGKAVDTEDDVLRRLTYMGEINASASAIIVDGETKVIVENEKIAEQVLQDIKDIFITDDESTEYEYIGFVEDVKIKKISTKLPNISNRSAAVEKLKNGGQKAAEYVVQEGDSMYGICEKLGVTIDELAQMNPGLTMESMLHIGDSIVIEREVPLLTLETIEVSTFAETVPFETEYRDSNYYYKGEEVTSREGQDGRASVTARLTKHNGEVVAREDIEREVIVQPVSKVILKGTKIKPPTVGTGSFIRPVNVAISSRYGYRWGRMHYGDDYAAATGTPIKASDGGTVVTAGWYYGYGLTVIINHGGGVKTLYGHCSSLNVSVGDKVFQGQNIAAVGNTGNSYGSHCHFEIIVNGRHVDPSLYV
ncbi:MAG: peptidoglycan DD-metalloendopeptidase family protein [Anaerovoracaceae bacterium]|nr:peptidoglycan DD-metalloendopeptidase family protein [Anaerovoracaceae bacterium]